MSNCAFAARVSADFDIIIPRKSCSTLTEEDPIVSVLPDESNYINELSAEKSQVTKKYLKQEVVQQRGEVKRGISLYWQNLKDYDINGNICIIADDGIASESTSLAAERRVRKHDLGYLITVAPIIGICVLNLLRSECDSVCYISDASDFKSVEQFYPKLEQVSDNRIKQVIVCYGVIKSGIFILIYT